MFVLMYVNYKGLHQQDYGAEIGKDLGFLHGSIFG